MTGGRRSRAAAPRERFTVVVLPSGSGGGEVLDLAAAWTAAGMLTPAAWVRPEDVDVQPARAPVVRCHFLGPWGDDDVSLFEVLGQHRRRLVRVVAAQVVAASGMVDQVQQRAALEVLDKVRYSVPVRVVDESGEHGTEVVGVNVVTAATGVSGAPRAMAPGGWDLHVVTSPEDRRDPGRANTFVRPGENLLPIALTAVATVGGLFAGVPEGPFDEQVGDASAVNGKCMVIRPTVRALLGERAVQEAAREAVAVAPEQGGPSRYEPDRFTTAIGTSLVDETEEWLDTLDGRALSVTPPVPDPTFTSMRVAFKQGVMAFLRFYGAALLAVPAAIWEAIVRRAERAATDAIVGGEESSGIVLTFRPGRSGLGETLLSWERQDIEQNEAAVQQADRRPVRMPTKELWHGLRTVTEALLDGSEPPPDAPKPDDGARRVLLGSAREIGPRPDDVFTLSAPAAALLQVATDSQRVVGACDPAAAAGLAAALNRALEERQQEDVRLGKEVEVRRRAAAAVDDDDATAKRQAEQELATAEAQLVAVREQAAVLRGEQSRLAGWTDGRSASLLWQVIDHVHRRVETSRTVETEAAADAVAPSGLDEGEPARMRRRFLRHVALMAAVMAVLAVLVLWRGSAVVDRIDDLLTGFRLWMMWAAWVLLLVAWFTRLVSAWYKGTLSYLKRFNMAAASRGAALNRFLVANADRRRLAMATEQLRGWAEVIGWTHHRPWSPDVPAAAQQGEALPAALLPQSLRLAEPVLNPATRSRAVDLGVGALTARGWRRRAFERLVAAEVGNPDPASVSRAIDDLEADATSSSGPRSRFLRALSTGEPQRSVIEDVIEEAAAELRGSRLGATSLQVHLQRAEPDEATDVDDVSFLAEALVPASPLATETWSAKAQRDARHAHPRSVAWAPTSVLAKADTAVEKRALDGAAPATTSFVDLVVRVDLAGPVELDDLCLFEPRPHAEEVTGLVDKGEYV